MTAENPGGAAGCTLESSSPAQVTLMTDDVNSAQFLELSPVENNWLERHTTLRKNKLQASPF